MRDREGRGGVEGVTRGPWRSGSPQSGGSLVPLKNNDYQFSGFFSILPILPQNLHGECATSGEFMQEDLGTRLALGNNVRIVRFLRHLKEMERRKRGAYDLNFMGGHTLRGIISTTCLVNITREKRQCLRIKSGKKWPPL